MHLKRVKRQIQIALAEAQAEARLKRENDASAEKVAQLKARENLWKHRIYHQ
jgi:hypothetical protein